MLLALPVLAACQTAGSDVLPTQFELPESTPGGFVPPSIEEIPIVRDPDPTLRGAGPGDASVPSFLLTPGANIPSDQPVSSQEPIASFEALAVGEPVYLIGQLESVSDRPDGGLPIYVIRDAQGNELIVDYIPPILQQLDGQEVVATGVILATADDDSRRIIQASSLHVPGEAPAGGISGMFSGPAAGPPGSAGAPGGMPPLPGQQLQTLDVQLGEDLTALQAYDALVDAADDLLEGLEWVSITGSRSLGWMLEFNNPTDNTGKAVNVAPDGTVQVSDTVLASLSGIINIPIERARVVVDSDPIEQEVMMGDPTAGTGSVMFSLRAASEESIVWTIIGTNMPPVDATTP